jgi:hypothetical protein
VPEARGGVVTVIQRSSSDMKLDPHLHAVAVDGAFVPGTDGQPSFCALPRLKADEVGDVLQVARVRILRYLARRGVVRLLPEAIEVSDDLAERDPVLAQLAAAVSGLPPASPELRCRPAVQLARTDRAGPTPMAALVVQELGFNLHAASVAGAEDPPARERLLRYVLRPPLAKERLTLLPDHRVRLELKRPFRDGTYALEMDVLSLLAPYSAKTRWRAWNGQRSIGDLPGQGDADGPDCALAGTDPVASAHCADLSAQQARMRCCSPGSFTLPDGSRAVLRQARAARLARRSFVAG